MFAEKPLFGELLYHTIRNGLRKEGVMSLRRFVFEMMAPHELEDERVWHGSIREVRAETADEAQRTVAFWWVVREGGVSTRLVGERMGTGSQARFFPLVDLSDVPEVICRLERIVGEQGEAA